MLPGLLAALLMTTPSPTEVWPHARDCHVAVAVHGGFSDRAPQDVNLINAPVGAARAPAPLPLAPGALDALNAQKLEALKAALADLGLAASEAPKDLARWRSLAKPVEAGQGDRFFKLDAELGGDNGLGGSRGGLAVHLVLQSLHRAPDVKGEAWVSVPVESAPDALRPTYVAGITQAFADLKSHSEDERLRPRARLTLVLELTGLSEAQRKDAAGVARCAAGLAEPLEQTARPPGAEALETEVTYRLRRHEADETEADFLQSYAGRLSFEIGPHGKSRCSLFGTSLAGYRAQVRADAEARRVTVRLVREEE